MVLVDGLLPRAARVHIADDAEAMRDDEFEAERAGLGVGGEALPHAHPPAVDQLHVVAAPVVLEAEAEPQRENHDVAPDPALVLQAQHVHLGAASGVPGQRTRQPEQQRQENAETDVFVEHGLLRKSAEVAHRHQHQRDVEAGVQEVDEQSLHGSLADGLALTDQLLDLRQRGHHEVSAEGAVALADADAHVRLLYCHQVVRPVPHHAHLLAEVAQQLGQSAVAFVLGV